MVPLCYAWFIAFTSIILLPGTNWKEKKATCKFLWTSSKPQTSSDTDPSRGRKRVWAHNKQRSLLCKQSFKQMDLNKQNFVGGRVKRKGKHFLLWKTCVISRIKAVAFQNTQAINPDHLPPPEATSARAASLLHSEPLRLRKAQQVLPNTCPAPIPPTGLFFMVKFRWRCSWLSARLPPAPLWMASTGHSG